MALKEVGIRGIAIDGVEGDVWLTACTGVPEVIKNRKNQEVAKLEIYVTGLEHPFGGYFPVNSSLGKTLQKFADDNKMVSVLFEQKRKNKKKLPKEEYEKSIIELRDTPEHAKETTVKIVGGILDWSSKKWIVSPEATLIEDKIPENWTNELIQKSVEQSFNNIEFAPVDETPKPVMTQDKDKNFCLINFYMFVKDMEDKYSYELSDERRKLVAHKLLLLADGFQKKFTGALVPNYKDYSHTRARGLVFQISERFVPLDNRVKTDDGLNSIMKEILSIGVNLLSWNLN